MVYHLWTFVIGVFVTFAMALPTDNTGSFQQETNLPELAGTVEKSNSSHPPNGNGQAQNGPTLFELMAAMIKHDHGMKHLGDDGVLRSFAPNGTVLDYVKLNASQVQQMVDLYGRNDHLTEVFDGVDGHNVSDHEQLVNPGEHLLPFSFKNWTKNALASLNTSPNPKSTFHLEGKDKQGAFATDAPTSENTAINPVQPRIQGAVQSSPKYGVFYAPTRGCIELRCRDHTDCHGSHPPCIECAWMDHLKGNNGWGGHCIPGVY